MKNLTSSSKIVFAFSDTAGANTCLSYAYQLQYEFHLTPIIFTNNPLFKVNDWNLKVNLVESLDERIPIDADYLFTGTSHPDTSKSFEAKAIQSAAKHNIYTISYIDHWTSFTLRFMLNGKLVLPNEIWVSDEKALSIAIEKGFSREILKIHSNPHLTYLSKFWKSKYLKKEFAAQLGIPSGNKMILIAPDPVSIRKETLQFGFTETSALNDLLSALIKLEGVPISIIIKSHPLQPVKIIQAIIEKFPALSTKVISGGDNLELINIADIVIGFYSNFLLEALAMQKPVLRYFPGDPNKDPLKHIVPLAPVSNMDKALLTLRDLFH